MILGCACLPKRHKESDGVVNKRGPKRLATKGSKIFTASWNSKDETKPDVSLRQYEEEKVDPEGNNAGFGNKHKILQQGTSSASEVELKCDTSIATSSCHTSSNRNDSEYCNASVSGQYSNELSTSKSTKLMRPPKLVIDTMNSGSHDEVQVRKTTMTQFDTVKKTSSLQNPPTSIAKLKNTSTRFTSRLHRHKTHQGVRKLSGGSSAFRSNNASSAYGEQQHHQSVLHGFRNVIKTWRDGAPTDHRVNYEKLQTKTFVQLVQHEEVLDMMVSFASTMNYSGHIELWFDLCRLHYMLDKSLRLLGVLSADQCCGSARDQINYIWNMYLVNDAPKWVCLDSDTYRITKQKVSENTTKCTSMFFKEVENFVIRDLEDMCHMFKVARRDKLVLVDALFEEDDDPSFAAKSQVIMTSILSPRHSNMRPKMKDLYKYTPAWELAVASAKHHNLVDILDLWTAIQVYFQLILDTDAAKLWFRHVAWVYGVFLMPESCRIVHVPHAVLSHVERVVQRCSKSESITANDMRGVFKELNGYLTNKLESSLVRIVMESDSNIGMAALRVSSPTKQNRNHDKLFTFGISKISKAVEKAIQQGGRSAIREPLNTEMYQFEANVLWNEVKMSQFMNASVFAGANSQIFLLYRLLTELESMNNANCDDALCIINTVVNDYLLDSDVTHNPFTPASLKSVNMVVDAGEQSYFNMMFYPIQKELVAILWQMNTFEAKNNEGFHLRQPYQSAFSFAPFSVMCSEVAVSGSPQLEESKPELDDLGIVEISLEQTLRNPISFEMLYAFSKRCRTSESLDLLVELCKYQNIDNQHDRECKAKFIWREFLENDSPRWNCLDSKTFDKVKKRFRKPFDQDTFLEVRQALVRDLEGDLFFRFHSQCKRELRRLQFGATSQAIMKIAKSNKATIATGVATQPETTPLKRPISLKFTPPSKAIAETRTNMHTINEIPTTESLDNQGTSNDHESDIDSDEFDAMVVDDDDIDDPMKDDTTGINEDGTQVLAAHNPLSARQDERKTMMNLPIMNSFRKQRGGTCLQHILALDSKTIVMHEPLETRLTAFLSHHRLENAIRKVHFASEIRRYRTQCLSDPLQTTEYFLQVFHQFVQPNIDNWVPVDYEHYRRITDFIPCPGRENHFPTQAAFNEIESSIFADLDRTVIQPFLYDACREVHQIVSQGFKAQLKGSQMATRRASIAAMNKSERHHFSRRTSLLESVERSSNMARRMLNGRDRRRRRSEACGYSNMDIDG